MNVVDEIKRRVANAAHGVVRELEVSHGVEGVTIAIKETGKSITVTVRESASSDDEGDDPAPILVDLADE